MLVQFIVTAGLVAALLCGLFIYSKVSKSDKPMMQGGCHGDCAHCSSHCDEDQKTQ